MDRRNFLKASGLALGCLAAGAMVMPKTKAALVIANGTDEQRTWPRGIPNSELVEIIKETLDKQLEPIVIDGRGFYLMFVHPQTHKTLKTIAARDKYKHEQHMIRHNRWFAKQGKRPEPVIVGEFGSLA